MDISINYFAVLAAALLNVALGWAWYSQMLFGVTWMKMVGLENSDMENKKMLYRGMILGLISSLSIAYVLVHFQYIAGVENVTEALILGFWLWFGFIATVSINMVAWEQKPWKLFFINTGFYLLSVLLMSIVLSIWR
jgi:hypothetical protein